MFRFAQLPFYAADAAGLCAAYDAAAPGASAQAPPALPYQRDGLLLMHRGATYAPGRSPLALSWRDAACSAWSIDVDDEAGGAAQGAHVVASGGAQRVVLRLLDAPPGALGTGDEPPAVLAAVPDWAGEPPAGALLRCELPAGGLHLDAEGRLCGAQLRVLGLAPGRRAEADTANRVRVPCYITWPGAALTRNARSPSRRRSWRSTPRGMRRSDSKRCSLLLRRRRPTTHSAAPPTPRRLTWTRPERGVCSVLPPRALVRALRAISAVMGQTCGVTFLRRRHERRCFLPFQQPASRETHRPGAPVSRTAASRRIVAVGSRGLRWHRGMRWHARQIGPLQGPALRRAVLPGRVRA